MSCRTLSRRFREHVGMTPAAWIARARVREAQRPARDDAVGGSGGRGGGLRLGGGIAREVRRNPWSQPVGLPPSLLVEGQFPSGSDYRTWSV